MTDENNKNTQPQQINVIVKSDVSNAIGIASFVFGIISIFFLAPLFVPLAVLLGIIAIVKKQLVWGILGLVSAFFGFITSPILMGFFGLMTAAINIPSIKTLSMTAHQQGFESDQWETHNGNWKITNEILMSGGGHIDSEILYKKLFSDNYTVQVDTMVLDGPGKSAIMFCHEGEDHFYQLEISASDNNAFLWQSGNWQKLAQSTLPIKYNNWYQLKVKLFNSKAYLYVDDTMLFSENVSCNYHHLGLRSAWTTSQFKNFLVNTQP